MCANETWINIEVYGPQSEINRLKTLCKKTDVRSFTDEFVIDFTALMPNSNLGQQYWSWNMLKRGHCKPGSFDFGFDAPGGCPIEIFESLALEFPTLSFYCSCIASGDEFMASGWFNGPPDSPVFEFFEVPPDYWEPGGSSGKTNEAISRHKDLVARLAHAAFLASQ